jgi:hypothetical protein
MLFPPRDHLRIGRQPRVTPFVLHVPKFLVNEVNATSSNEYDQSVEPRKMTRNMKTLAWE